MVPGCRMKMPRDRKLVGVIEDDPLVREATEGLLQSWGCRVVAAETCDKAIKELSQIGERPDLIVCDYRLPEGPTGADAIAILRSAFEIPALLISADVNSPRGDATGGYSLLYKPVTAEAFRAALVDASVLRR
jgi:two-component system, sensor histidine kinase